MMRGRGRARLSDAKGGDALNELLKSMAPSAPPPPSPSSAEDLAEAMLRRARSRPAQTDRVCRPVPQTKATPKKQIIKMSARAAQEALERAGLTSSHKAVDAAKASPITDFGASAYQRIEQLRPRLEDFVADARAPATVDDEARAVIRGRIARGASVSDTIVDADADGYIGHDFGTSTTKAVVRWPYERSLGEIAIPVPDSWCSGGIPHLWPTAVYFNPLTRSFSLLPGDGSMELKGFKSALIEGRGHRMCCGSAATMVDASIAFLAMHLAYVLGSVAEQRPGAKVSAVNVGVPVAALADREVYATFDAVVRAAILLLNSAALLTLEDVVAARALSDQGPLPYELHTELAGAIAGYCSAPRYHRGAHMIIDCGSATLDIASFDLGDGQWPVAIHAADVEPLGADACAVYRSAGATAEDCRGAARYQEHRVFARTMQMSSSGFRQNDSRKYPYQIILVGGGIHGEIHRPLLERMEMAFQRPFFHPELDRGLVCEAGSHAGRLILADGLARAPVDLREVAMPRDCPPPPLKGIPEMVSKDQV